MLLRMVAVVSVAAAALALAACAETGGAIAGAYATEAAEVAATQATIATTQAINQLEQASTRMSRTPHELVGGPRTLPMLPPIHRGNMVLITHNFIVIQKNGKRFIVRRDPYVQEEEEREGLPQ